MLSSQFNSCQSQFIDPRLPKCCFVNVAIFVDDDVDVVVCLFLLLDPQWRSMKSRREKHQNLLRLFSKTFYSWYFFGNRHLIFWRWLLSILSTSSKNRINKFTNKLIINTFIDNLTSCVVFARQLKSTQHSLHQRIYLIRGTQREYSSKPLKHSLFNVFQYLNGRYRQIFIP